MLSMRTDWIAKNHALLHRGFFFNLNIVEGLSLSFQWNATTSLPLWFSADSAAWIQHEQRAQVPEGGDLVISTVCGKTLSAWSLANRPGNRWVNRRVSRSGTLLSVRGKILHISYTRPRAASRLLNDFVSSQSWFPGCRNSERKRSFSEPRQICWILKRSTCTLGAVKLANVAAYCNCVTAVGGRTCNGR